MRSGERCDLCGIGRMRTRTTITRGSSRVRYLVCVNCGATGKETLRIDDLGRSIILPVVATHSKQGDAPLQVVGITYTQEGTKP